MCVLRRSFITLLLTTIIRVNILKYYIPELQNMIMMNSAATAAALSAARGAAYAALVVSERYS